MSSAFSHPNSKQAGFATKGRAGAPAKGIAAGAAKTPGANMTKPMCLCKAKPTGPAGAR